MIKFDRRDWLIGLATAGGTSVGSVALSLILYYGHLPKNGVLDLLALISFWLPLVALACWVYAFEIKSYLYRLKKHGYEVPEKKSTYGRHMGNLPRTEKESMPENSRESTIMASICFLCTVGFPFEVVRFRTKYNMMQDMMSFVMIVLAVLSALWCIGGLYYWRQRSTVKFRDDVEIDEKRKPRKHIVEGMVEILLMLGISLLFCEILYQFVNVVYKSRVQAGWY